MAQPDIFTLKSGAEVKMKYGLLNELVRVVGDLDQVHLVNYDPVISEQMLLAMLVKRDAKGKPTEEISLAELDLDTEEAMELLDWAGGHVADFFVKALAKAKIMVDEKVPALKALMPTSPGGVR